MKYPLPKALLPVMISLALLATSSCSCRKKKAAQDPCVAAREIRGQKKPDLLAPSIEPGHPLLIDSAGGKQAFSSTAVSPAKPGIREATPGEERNWKNGLAAENPTQKAVPLGAPRAPFWVVERFTEKPHWLATHSGLVDLKREWGAELTHAVRKELLKRSLTVESVSRKLTPKQAEALAATGMKYLCGGQLEALAVTQAGGKQSAGLLVIYELKRSTNGKVRLVQKKRLRVSHDIAGTSVSEADLAALIDVAAQKIAARIAEHIPSDLAAARG